jgi:hypothetical protein
MFNRFVLCLVTIVLFAGLLLAHGDPIMGTVTAVSNDTFTVQVKDNKPVVIFSEPGPYQSGSIHQRRTYLKVAVMLRVP